MPAIHIVISDVALRNAISEGIAVAKLGEASETSDLATALKDTDTVAVILDEATTDKKPPKTLQDETAGQKGFRVFLLGEADAAWASCPAVESFPKPLRLGHLLTRLSFHMRTRPRRRNTWRRRSMAARIA